MSVCHHHARDKVSTREYQERTKATLISSVVETKCYQFQSVLRSIPPRAFLVSTTTATMAEEKQPNGYATAGRARRMSEVVLQQLDERIQKEENIFLFLPNIIGEANVHERRNPRLTSSRLLSSHTCNSLPLLHASTSANMLATLQRIVPPRRPRRLRSAKVQPVNHIRCCLGHGHRSMHYLMSAGLPGFSISKMEHYLSGLDQS